jgi:phosphoglucomutase
MKVVKDYSDLTERNLLTGDVWPIHQKITSDVLQFFTEDGTKISVRPSGTEPKIKFYFEVTGKLTSRDQFDEAEKLAEEKIESIMKELDL